MAYLTWATLVFAAALVLVEFADSRGDDLTDRPISHYFKTGTSVVQATMFAVMAGALWGAAWQSGSVWLSLSMISVGLGLVLAMSTDTWPQAFFGADRALHYTGAALCFVAGLSMMLAAGTYTYAIAYAAGALLLYAIDREHTAVQEKVGVLMLIVWVFGFSVNLP
ncbi:MAG: hypothetical protein ACK5JE_13340 [Castellaniella sp.]|uniref:hypothetical protein n=1 Tax=Castellaniella sp. TaxID=1955812 RepID=UPI003A89CB84